MLTQARSILSRIRRSLDLSHAGFRFSNPYGPRRVPAEPYRHVAPVYACVKAKAEAIAGLPVMISTADDRVLESGPLVGLLARPNPRMTSRAFLRLLSAYLDLFGVVHLRIVPGMGGTPAEVWPLNPARVKPEVTPTGELVGWRYRPPGSAAREERLGVEEVHTFTDPDFPRADEPFTALAPQTAAKSAIAQYFKADIANEASLDNDVSPSGMFKTPGNLTDPQRRVLKEEINERFQGAGNRHRYMITEGGLEWQAIGSAFKDMEFTELKQMTRTDICAAYGVPPAVVGFYEESNYAHASAAEEAFWIRTILPRAAWIAEELTLGVLARFGGDRSLALSEARSVEVEPRLRKLRTYAHPARAARSQRQRFFVWFDPSGVMTVQRAQLAAVEQVKEWVSIGVPLNQALRATDAPFQEVPWGNTWFRPAGLIDVQESSGTPADPDGSGETGLMSGRQQRTPAAPAAPPEVRVSEAERAALWEQWRQSWHGLERAVESRVKRHWFELRSETLERLARLLPERGLSGAPALVRRDTLGALLFELTDADGRLRVKLGGLFREAVQLGGEQSVREAADAQGTTADPFNLSDPGGSAALRRRDTRIVGLNRTVRQRLSDALAEGLEAGEGVRQLSERVKSVMNEAGNRSSTIARTEVGAAVEEGRHAGRLQAKVPLKSWLHARKETGRPTHAETEALTMRQPVPIDEDFVIFGTGVTCPHPRATGRPEHDINCGCTSISRYPGDTVRAATDRLQQRGFFTYEQLTQLGHGSAQPNRTDANPCPTA